MNKIQKLLLPVFLFSLLQFTACTQKEVRENKSTTTFISQTVHPEWSKNANIYELNVRQFTPEGTFNAIEGHLPRLKELGIDIIWFMPIHPIGIKNRKGELGSYYSVKDYLDVNPEFGNLNDFKKLVKKAHGMGFHILIDWVPNHSSWDNPIAAEHPEWYMKDSAGNFIPPLGTDWTDVIQLDWSQKGLQDYMIEAFKFWVNAGVDGFRVDHPDKTPPEFWERARTELEKIKPVLILAENEDQLQFMEKGFDVNYAWKLHHIMNEIAQGKKNVNDLRRYFKKEEMTYPPEVYRLIFMTNHDENSWAGTINERLGESQRAFAVFMFTVPGMPLIYNGQEDCLDKRLKFFERDPIYWKECALTGFYKDLIRLKKDNIALWNGTNGGTMNEIKTSHPKDVFVFSREKDGNRLLVFLNLGKKPLKILPDLSTFKGDYSRFTTKSKVSLPLKDSLSLEAWGYKVLIQK